MECRIARDGEAIPGSSSRPKSDQIADEAPPLLERAVGVEWYERSGNEADRAMLALCRLRRARAGEKGARAAWRLRGAARALRGEPAALVWIVSRAVSYMDETGFPEAVEPWFRDDLETRGLTLPAWLARAALHPQRSRRQSRRTEREERRQREIGRQCDPGLEPAPRPPSARPRARRRRVTASSMPVSESPHLPSRPRARSRVPRADGSGSYWGSGAPWEYTRSSRSQTWTKIRSIAGRRRYTGRVARSRPGRSRRP